MAERKKAPPHAWKPGQSGNPRGKSAGCRNKATVMVTKLMEADAKEIVMVIINAAKKGDLTAAKMVLDRLAPPVRERAIYLALPDTSTVAGISHAQQAILAAVAAGEILPAEGTALTGIVESRRRAVETVDLEHRIAELEKSHAKK